VNLSGRGDKDMATVMGVDKDGDERIDHEQD